MTVQVLLTADNHLDPPAMQYGPRRYDRRRDYLRSFQAVVDYALENKPDLFLVSGDLFHGIRPRNPVRAQVMDLFHSLYQKGVKTFLISGHHDTSKSRVEAVSPLAVYGESRYVTYFENSAKPTTETINIKGREVAVSGISYNPFLRGEDDPLAGIKLDAEGEINILMLHYPILGFEGYFGNETCVNPESIPHGLQLVAAGHLHKYQRSMIKDIPVVYPGSTERMSFREEDERKGFAWIEMDRAGTVSTEFVETNAREMRTIDFRLPDQGNINQQAMRRLFLERDPELILRLRLAGSIDVKRLSTYRRSDILSYAQDKFFALIPEEDKIEILLPTTIKALPRVTPLEQLRAYFHKRILEAEDEREKGDLEEALLLCEEMLQEAGAW